MDVASLSTLKCSSEKGMYGCGIFIDLRVCNVLVKRVCMDVASLSTLKGMYGCGIYEKGMYGCGIFSEKGMYGCM